LGTQKLTLKLRYRHAIHWCKSRLKHVSFEAWVRKQLFPHPLCGAHTFCCRHSALTRASCNFAAIPPAHLLLVCVDRTCCHALPVEIPSCNPTSPSARPVHPNRHAPPLGQHARRGRCGAPHNAVPGPAIKTCSWERRVCTSRAAASLVGSVAVPQHPQWLWRRAVPAAVVDPDLGGTACAPPTNTLRVQ
jgi:hypothetical protein